MSNQLELFPGNALAFHGGGGRSATTPLERSVSDRKERLTLRNKAMIARLYYWREIMRRRMDDVIIILAEKEFFVEERTINNAWIEHAEFYEQLCSTHASTRQLRRMYPNWNW